MTVDVNRRVLPGFALSLGYTLFYLSLVVLVPMGAGFLKASTLSFDALTRLSLVLGIYKSLQLLYPDPPFSDRWIRLPNSHPLFGGRRPQFTGRTDGL